MSGVTNERVSFERWNEFVAYRAEFADILDNVWQMTVIGLEEMVLGFIDARPFVLEARPLTPALWLERETVWAEAEEQVQAETEEKSPAADGPSEGKTTWSGIGLRVEMALIRPSAALTFPYLVSFEIDPCMTNAQDQYTFTLAGNDTSANVRFKSNKGKIWIKLYNSNQSDQSKCGYYGSVCVRKVAKRSEWTVEVNRCDGNPCYTLRGDITVF